MAGLGKVGQNLGDLSVAYRFKLKEDIQQGLRRILTEQIERAVVSLSADDSVTAVHDARKSLKRIRALLRLLRHGLGNETFATENARFRDIAHLLSQTRDIDVMIAIMTQWQAARGHGKLDSAYASLLEILVDQKAATRQSGTTAQIADAVRRLDIAPIAVQELVLTPPTFAIIEQGLSDTLRRCRQRLKRAYDDDSDEAFHDWRKTVQLHWRHMRLLEQAWPDYFLARATLASELSQCLGEAQDMALLLSFLDSPKVSAMSPAAIDEVRETTLNHQERMRKTGYPMGQRLLADKPAAFASSAAIYWQTAIAARSVSHKTDKASPGPDKQPAPLEKRRRI